MKTLHFRTFMMMMINFRGKDGKKEYCDPCNSDKMF